MDTRTGLLTRTIDGVPAWRWAAQGLWIAARLLAVLYFGEGGAKFFYQGF